MYIMTQFWIYEIQTYEDGTFGDIKHFAYDEDPDKARLKADSKFYEVLSAAAISNLPCHAVTMVSSEGFPVMHQCYKHTPVNPAPEPEGEPVEE